MAGRRQFKKTAKKFHVNATELRRHLKILDAAMKSEAKDSTSRKLAKSVRLLAEKYLTEKEQLVEKIEIGSDMKAFRARQKMSQDELAAKIGVGRRQIIRWEQGYTKPHYVFLRKLEELEIVKK